MSFFSILKDIKSLRIQGAESVALAGVSAQMALVSSLGNTRLKAKMAAGRTALMNARPTEPCMQNALFYLMNGLPDTPSEYRAQLNTRSQYIIRHFKEASALSAKNTARKIGASKTIFTHCHSSAVVNGLKLVHNQGRRFSVNVTETRPFLQGRLTARELGADRIPVTLFVDSAVRLALKKADIVLLGADAISAEGKIINKVGSEVIAILAASMGIPVYVCTDSWKFDPRSVFGFERELEQRSSKEVWDKPPTGVKVSNYVFEQIDPKLVAGIISELGVFAPESFVQEVRKNYPWMF